MADAGLTSRTDDEVWQRLANAMARGAEHDSNERRPFSDCLPGTRVELLNQLESSLADGGRVVAQQEPTIAAEGRQLSQKRRKIEQEERKIIWLFGGSGSGKSSVAYSTAERLRSKNLLAATFFFSRKDLTRSNTDHIFLTIAYQVGILHHQARERIIKAIRNDPDLLSPHRSRRAQFEKLVIEPLRYLQFAWSTSRAMIFDAADEGQNGPSSHIKDLVHMLAELLHDPTIPISSILFTSRPHPSFESLAKHNDFIGLIEVLRIESFDSKEDITKFLRQSFLDIYVDRELELIQTLPWPSDVTLGTLANTIGGQFIVAATIIKLVRDASEPIRCLDLVSSMYQGKVDFIDIDLGNIDSVYHYILSDCDLPHQRPGVECLADIVALAEPLLLSDICKLFGNDIRKRIVHLSGAIVHVPPLESTATVQIYHASLRDYLSDSSRSGDFHVRPTESHHRLVCLCLKLMQRELKKDICGLGDPSVFHDEIPDFHRLRDQSISGALRYACLFWPYHLARSGHDNEIQTLVLSFLKKQLFFFIEVASILGCLHLAVVCLSDAERVISRWESFDDKKLVLQLLYDAWRLVLQFLKPIRQSALQVYESALPMCPLHTQLRFHYREMCMQSTVTVDNGLPDRWGYGICTFNISPCSEFVVSPNGRQLAALKPGLGLWDTATGVFITSPHLEHLARPDHVVFSPNGSILACQCDNGRACLWYPQSNLVMDLVPSQPRHSWPKPSSACAFATDNQTFASGYCDGSLNVTIRLFDWDPVGKSWLPHKPIALKATSKLWNLEFSRAGPMMIVTANGLYIVDTKTHDVSHHIPERWESCSWQRFSGSGDSLLDVGLRVVRQAHLQLGSSGYGVSKFQVVEDATMVSEAQRVHAVLLGDYIYTAARQIHIPSRTKPAGHFSSAMNRSNPLVVDLSLLIDQVQKKDSDTKNDHSDTNGIILRALRCFPDKKLSVIAKYRNDQELAEHNISESHKNLKPIQRTAIERSNDVKTGWETIFITLTGPVVEPLRAMCSQIPLSRTLDLVASYDGNDNSIHLRSLENTNLDFVLRNTLDENPLTRYQEFSPQSTYFLIVAKARLHIWSIKQERQIEVIDDLLSSSNNSSVLGVSSDKAFLPGKYRLFAFSDDESILAVVKRDGVVIHFIGSDKGPIPITAIPTTLSGIDVVHLVFRGPEHGFGLLLNTRFNMALWRFKASHGSIPTHIEATVRESTLHFDGDVEAHPSPRLRELYVPRDVANASRSVCYNIDETDQATETDDGGIETRSQLATFKIARVYPRPNIIDSMTWSNVAIVDNWLCVGARRICWLPDWCGEDKLCDGALSVFNDTVLLQLRTPERKTVVLRIKGMVFHYYDS